MNTRRLLGAAALGAVGAVTIAATLVVVDPDITARAAEGAAVTSAAFGFGHGGGRHGRHGGLERFCGVERGEKVEKMLGFVENFMEFSGPQKAAFDELAAAVRGADKNLDSTCAAIREEGRPEKAPQRLAVMEKMMQGALGGVQEVRPAFEKFYATLSEKQQTALDDLFRRGGRHH